MVQAMMKRVIDNGVQGQYLVADEWCGSKRMIGTALSLGVCPIFQMNKGKEQG